MSTRAASTTPTTQKEHHTMTIMTSKPKTKAKTFTIAEEIEKAEQTAISQAALSKAEAADAQDSLRARQEEQERVLEALEAITEAIADDPDSVTQAELNEARGALEFANLAVAGAERRISKLPRVAGVTTHEVSDALLPAIQAMLPGVPIYSTFVTPPTVSTDDLPVAFIVQQEQPVDTRYGTKGGGAITAQVHLFYYAAVIHRPLEESTLKKALSEAGIDLDGFPMVRVRDAGDGVLLGSARLRPTAVVPPIPVVTFNPYRLQLLATDLAGKFAKTSLEHRKVAHSSAEVSSTTTDENGLRTTAVVVKVATKPYSNGSFSTGKAKVIGTPESVVAAEAGTFCDGVGRIRSADLTASRRSESGSEFEMSLDFISYAA